MSVKLDEPMSEVVKIHEKPYFPNTLTTKQEYILSDYKTMVTHSYQNLLTIDDSQFQTNDCHFVLHLVVLGFQLPRHTMLN